MVSTSEVISRMDPDALIRVWDRDKDKQILDGDILFMQQCLDIAENTAKLYLNKAFADAGPPYDSAILSAIVAIALYEAVKYSPTVRDLYRRGHDDAIALFKNLRRDEVRPQVMNSGNASNQSDGAVGNVTIEDGGATPTGIWSEIANGRMRSGF